MLQTVVALTATPEVYMRTLLNDDTGQTPQPSEACLYGLRATYERPHGFWLTCRRVASRRLHQPLPRGIRSEGTLQ